MFCKSPVTTLSYEFCIYLHFLSTDTHTRTHTSLHVTPLVWIHLHRVVHTHTDMYTVTQAKNKDINMTKCLCGSTQRSIHTLRDTLICSKGSRGSSELTNPLVDESTGSLVNFFFTVLLYICLVSSHLVSISGPPKKNFIHFSHVAFVCSNLG